MQLRLNDISEHVATIVVKGLIYYSLIYMCVSPSFAEQTKANESISLATSYEEMEELLANKNTKQEVEEQLGNASPVLWRDMSLRHEYPAVAITGFRFLAESPETPNSIVRNYALAMVLAAPRPGSPHLGEALAWIRDNIKDQESVSSTIDWIAKQATVTPDNISIILLAMNSEQLFEWFRSRSLKELEHLPASLCACLIDRLSEDYKAHGDFETKSAAVLGFLKEVPGHPRLVYVLHSTDKDEVMGPYLQAVLHDFTIDNLQHRILLNLVVSRHKEMMRRSIDTWSTDWPKPKIDLVREALSD